MSWETDESTMINHMDNKVYEAINLNIFYAMIKVLKATFYVLVVPDLYLIA